MGFLEDAQRHADEVNARAAWSAEHQRERVETLRTFVGLLRDRNYQTLPVYEKTQFQSRSLPLRNRQHHRLAGEGWYLPFSLEEGWGYLVITSNGLAEACSSSPVSTKHTRSFQASSTRLLGIPRSGIYLVADRLTRFEDLTSDVYWGSSMKFAAAAILNGGRQTTLGMAAPK